MSEARLSRLEDRLAGIEDRLAALEARFSTGIGTTVGSGGSLPDTGHTIAPAAAAGADSPDTTAGSPSIVTLFGRFLMILGGAFLLRAGTDSGALPPYAGVSAGLLYGLAQLWLASRAAARGNPQSANWFGFGGAAILLPLIAESTLDFQILSTGVAAVLLALLGFAGVAVAFRFRLRAVAWAFLAGAGSIGLFLAARTGFGLGFPLGVLLVGLAGLWMGYLRAWYGLAIVGSVVPVAMVAVVTLLVALGFEDALTANLTPAVALTLQLLLVASFLGSFLARALRWSAPVGLPEMMQSITALTIGTIGSMISAHKDPSLNTVFGLVMLLTGLGCYAISFRRIDRREGGRRNFAFFSSVALVATLTGSARILGANLELALFITAALVLSLAGARRQRSTLSLHAAIYVIAAGASSGLLGLVLDTLSFDPAGIPGAAEVGTMLLVIVVAVVCTGAPVARQGRTWGKLSRLPKALYISFLFLGMGGLLVAAATSRFAVLPGDGFDAGLVAALRTGAFAVGAIVLGFVSRWPKLREGARLVPVLLVFGGLALGLGDLRDGRPATQFASMALYGLALILSPRLARRPNPDPDEVSPDNAT